ncbi:pyrimidine/purine nucleoside phosphorylase [Halarcobacter anaerophilus]|uniref:pyrimidine/purine nucleoside phosphorylase n=1 Tax=Halarcobacter anaerophilus TaxID=877500 RepID=UPI0005CB3F5A|nr:pyrimidine/purine nucleoside phosphorylase [Halarcobacter anaerophilus]
MEFNNVSIAKEANILYDGNITSRTITFEDGTKKTLGIMLPGEYELNTVNKSTIDINSGVVEVMLPAEDWVQYVAPASIKIAQNSKYKLRVSSLVDYCCSFEKVQYSK